MATTDEELEQKRQHVQKLREQVANEVTKRETRERELGNDVVAIQLDAEATRLQAALDAAKAANKVAAVKEGASTVFEAVKTELSNAEYSAKAQEDARAASSANKGADAESAEALAEAALEKAAEANAKESASGATHVPEGMAESTTTDNTKGR